MRSASDVTVDRFDLHDIGAEVREDLTGIRAKHDRPELEDSDAFEERDHDSDSRMIRGTRT